MPAPTPTTRVTPTAAAKLRNGSRSLITFASDPNIELWEKTITPPGIDGGPLIPTGDMHSDNWRTKAVQRLKEMTEGGFTANYDPKVYVPANLLINTETTITITFPDLSSVCFYGALRSFRPGVLADGTQPEATCTFEPTNTDPTDGSEQGPVYTPPPP